MSLKLSKFSFIRYIFIYVFVVVIYSIYRKFIFYRGRLCLFFLCYKLKKIWVIIFFFFFYMKKLFWGCLNKLKVVKLILFKFLKDRKCFFYRG